MTTEGVDLRRLADWMDEQGLPAGPLTEVEPLAGGTQNIVLRFRRGPAEYVLRRPPVHRRPGSDETMRREARVLGALTGSGVPHPRLVASCPDEAVLGAAFYLMEPIVGANPTIELPGPYLADPTWRRRLGLAMAEGAAAIGEVDHIASGLGDLGRPDGFLERQVPRWRRQLDSYTSCPGYPGPDLPGVDAVGAWLDAHLPGAWKPGLMHGDYHLANVLCDPDRPRLAAIVDWELATIGDPLLDLGGLLATWPDATGEGIVTVTPWGGFPSPDELVAEYARCSSRDLTSIVWYEVLACYKLGIVLEGTHARAAGGQASESTGERLHAAAHALFRRAGQRIAA